MRRLARDRAEKNLRKALLSKARVGRAPNAPPMPDTPSQLHRKRQLAGNRAHEVKPAANALFRVRPSRSDEREHQLAQLGPSVLPYSGQYNLSRWLLKIEQDVDRPCLRIRLQEAPDFVVMEGKAAECFLRAVDNKVVVSASIEDRALWDLPCRANPPLAFE